MRTLCRFREGYAGRHMAVLAALGICLAGFMAGAPLSAADTPARPAGSPALLRRERPPRKVLLGTVVSGQEIFKLALDKRLQRMDELAEAFAAEAKSSYPGKQLDLVVFPEAKANSARFPIITHPVNEDGVTVLISMAAGEMRRSNTMALYPCMPPLTLSASKVTGGTAVVGTVSLYRPDIARA